MVCATCAAERPAGRGRSIWRWSEAWIMARLSAGSAGLVEQLAADQHAADLAGAGTNLIELGIAPQSANRVFVDVAVAAQNLNAVAGHACGILGAIQNHRGTVLADLAQVSDAQRIKVLAHGIAECPARLQAG